MKLKLRLGLGNGGSITPPAYPLVATAPVASGTATQGQTLSTTNGTWTNSPTGYTYQWRRAGVDISGATSSTYVLTNADADALITCAVTAANASGSNTSSSNAIGPIVALAPTNSVVPVISGTTTEGQTLSTTNGTWANNPTFSYQWKRGGVAISGATASTYVLVGGDAGATITVTVTGTNSGGSASATSTGVGPITGLGGSAPGNTVLPAVSGTAQDGSTLSANQGTWTGSPSYVYQWFSNTVAATTGSPTSISMANTLSYAAVTADVGLYLYLRVSATNGGGTTTVYSNIVGPVAAAGSLSAPTLTQTSATGAAPYTWDTTTNVLYEGLTIHFETSADGVKDGSGYYVTPVQSITKVLQNADIASGDITLTTAVGASADFVTPSGSIYLHGWIESDDGTTITKGAISNELHDTIGGASTVLTATNGFDKKSDVAVSGTPALSMDVASFPGSFASVRATQAGNAGNEVYFEVKLIRFGSGVPGSVCAFGWDAGTRDLSAYGAPGISDSTGFYVGFQVGSQFAVNWNSGGGTASTSTTAVNDTIGIKINRTTKVVTAYLIRAGSVIDTVTGTVPSATYFSKAFGTAKNDEKLTFNFGQSAFLRALDSGVVAYG